MPDGVIQIGEDGQILTVSGEVAAADECCSVASPCFCCKDYEPEAVVTVECGGVNDCTDFEGVYAFKSFDSDDSGTYACCMWLMEMIFDGDWYRLYLLWWPAEERWTACIIGRGGPAANRFGAAGATGWSCHWGGTWHVDVTGDVECTGRELSGSFTLTGQDNCADCTASVTIS